MGTNTKKRGRFRVGPCFSVVEIVRVFPWSRLSGLVRGRDSVFVRGREEHGLTRINKTTDEQGTNGQYQERRCLRVGPCFSVVEISGLVRGRDSVFVRGRDAGPRTN